jgi:predicted RNA-binding protein with PIN domain
VFRCTNFSACLYLHVDICTTMAYLVLRYASTRIVFGQNEGSETSERTVGRDILVDGYNVIKRDASFEALSLKSLAAARQLLVNQIATRYRHTPHQVIVVFDGDGISEQSTQDRRVRIVYSRAGETADTVIARLAASARAAGHEVELYSDDSEVRQSVAQQGGSVGSTNQLTKHLNAAPADLARLSHHRQQARRQYGLDPSQKYELDEYQPTSSHKRKKGKKTRH